ncbi:MAG: hypothetical protein ACT4TC_05155 [Myxococcaceae bacterium]
MLPRNRRPTAPAIILRDILSEWKLSRTAFAKALGLRRRVVDKLLAGELWFAPQIAERIGKYFRQTTRFWTNLQAAVDEWDSWESRKNGQVVYYARLELEDDAVNIVFPDCPGCLSFARPLNGEDVVYMARDALEGWLESKQHHREKLPVARYGPRRGKRVLGVVPKF